MTLSSMEQESLYQAPCKIAYWDSTWRSPGDSEDQKIPTRESMVPWYWSSSQRQGQRLYPMSSTHTLNLCRATANDRNTQQSLGKVSIDFCGPFPSGDYFLIVIDEFSRFPEVEILKSTSSRAVIPSWIRYSQHMAFQMLPNLTTAHHLIVTSLKTLQSTWVLNTAKSHHIGRRRMVKLSVSCAP